MEEIAEVQPEVAAVAGGAPSSSYLSSSPSSPPPATRDERLGEEERDGNSEEEEEEEEEGDRDEEEDEDEDVCRICRNPGDEDSPLRYPCACSGSIKFVHQDCLLQWLNHSNARHCEVCKHMYSFSPVYADNAPARLPIQELIVGLTMKAYHVFQFFLRLSVVLSVWLLIIPFITFWIWRFTFTRSFVEAQRLFLSHASAPLILTDCLHGFLLSASIVFIFLGATSLRDYFRHLREHGVHDAEREDEHQERHGARAARRPPGLANRIHAADVPAEDAGGAQGIVAAGQLIMRNAENVAARLELQAARLEAQVEQIFEGLDDADGADDVPFDELVGMQGPVFHLVENAVTVLASNAIFLGVVIFIPFSIGRIVLLYVSWFSAAASSPMLSAMKPLTESSRYLVNITSKNALTDDMNLTSKSYSNGFLGHFVGIVTGSLNINATSLGELPSNVHSFAFKHLYRGLIISPLHISDVATLAAGYLFIFSLVFFYLGVVVLIRYMKGERLTIGRFYGIVAIAEAIPSLVRQLLAGMRHMMTMIKVAFLLVIELGVFPLMCGWWLDVCTIRMLGSTIARRVEFFYISPLLSSFLHWLVGIVYMLQISIFVSLLRGVLRNGVLYFLRDPADPNYNPFRDLIDDPVHKHARRVLLSVAVYGSLIVMIVFLPVKLAMRLAPSVFPLGITFSDPFTEIPVDSLVVQICIPFAIKYFKPRATIKVILRHWFQAVGWALGLTDFLLPRNEDNIVPENGNAEIGRREGLRDAHQVGAGQQNQVQIRRFAADGERGALVIVNPDAAEEAEGFDQAGAEYGFVLRIVILLLLAWMTLVLFNCALIVAPVSIGRALFSAIPRLPITHGIKCNDFYAFNIGFCVILFLLAGAKYSIEYIQTQRAGVLISHVWRWSTIVLKSSALLSIWILVIPILIGLLLELLIIVPMRVPVDESPVFLLYQDWALGFMFLKLWTRLVMMDQMVPFVDVSWRLKFQRVREDGFSRLRGLWVLREIVIPIVAKLLTALCVPYVFARGVFPVLGYPLVVNSAVYRFAWLGCLFFSLLWFSAKRCHVWLTDLHDSIRDDRYLVGRRLHDFGEDKTEETSDPRNLPDVHEMNPPVAGLLMHRDNEGDGVGLRLRHANRHPNQQ